MALAALANAVLVPAGNILSILVLVRHDDQGRVRPRVVRAVLTNPLVLACAVGLLLNAASRTDRMQPSGAGRPPSCSWRPVLRCWVSWVRRRCPSGCCASGSAAVTVVVLAALPTASSSYVLARRLGGDAPLMANLTATQTAIAFLTLPAWILLSQAVL